MKFRYGVVSLSLLMVIVWLAGCGGQTVVSGPADQWIRAKNLSVRVSFAEGNVGTIGIRNDSSKEVHFFPIIMKGTYKAAGKKETTMRSGEVEILKPGAEFLLPVPQFLQLESGPSSIAANDVLNKLQVEVGPESSKEVFTITR